MKFGKNANINGKWTFIELSDEEVEEALKNLLKFNIKQFTNIMGIDEGFEYKKILADKLLVSSYTYLNYVLDEKIEKIRNSERNVLMNNPIYRKAEKYVEQKMKETSEDKNTEIIENIFKKVIEENPKVTNPSQQVHEEAD